MMQDVAHEAEKAKTFTPGAPAAAEQKLTDEHRAIYAERIAKATTVEEVCVLFVLALRGEGGGMRWWKQRSATSGFYRGIRRFLRYVFVMPWPEAPLCFCVFGVYALR